MAFASSSSILNEIKMSSKNLEKLSNNIDAKIGIEYEFVFQSNDDIDNQELEEKGDIPVNQIISVINFFLDDDTDQNDSDLIDEMESYLEDRYTDWLSEKIDEYINDEKNEDYLYNILINTYVVTDHKKIQKELVDNLNKMDITYEQLKDAYRWHQSMSTSYRDNRNSELEADIKRISNSKELGLETYYKARKKIYDRIEKEIDESLKDSNSYLYKSLRNFLKNYDFKQRNFLKEQYGNSVSDVYEKLKEVEEFKDLSWPLIYPDSENDILKKAEETFKDYEDSFIGYYDVETDSSVVVDDEYNEIGLEIKNAIPLLSLEETIYDFTTMVDFISNHGYLNDSTGLHINVSTKNFNKDKVDYIKLVLLLGDEYILEKFSRLGNSYTTSSLDRLNRQTEENERIKILNSLQEKLNDFAGDIINLGMDEKYVSVNLQGNRVEFRSPGGDWIDNEKQVIDTITRFIVVLDAAIDPNKYKEEYAKKLYKWINPPDDYNDTIKIFSMLQSNMIPPAAAKSYLRKIQRDRPTHYLFGHKDGYYVWGSGETKKEALEDAKKEVEKQGDLWSEELKLCKLFPTNKETHDEIQSGNTFTFRKMGDIYIEK